MSRCPPCRLEAVKFCKNTVWLIQSQITESTPLKFLPIYPSHYKVKIDNYRTSDTKSPFRAMAHEQQFRGFLKLFSDTTVFNAASKESPAEQDMLEFIQCHGAKDGMCLKIPSLCSSVDPSSLDNSEPEASYPAAVLKSALKTGHPLRAARGKQDRSHRAQTNTATVEVGDNGSIESSTDLKAVDKKTKAEKIQGNIARTLKYYSRPCPASDQPNMSGGKTFFVPYSFNNQTV